MADTDKSKADAALAGAAPTAEEQAASEATPEAAERDAELLALVQAVNEGRASADDLDLRRVHKVTANVGLLGLRAGEEGYAPADAETAAQMERGLLTKS
jgi:hypothetical protein